MCINIQVYKIHYFNIILFNFIIMLFFIKITFFLKCENFPFPITCSKYEQANIQLSQFLLFLEKNRDYNRNHPHMNK